MWLRKILIAAAVAAPLALSPVQAFAQGRGPERAAEVRQNGTPPTAGAVVTELPQGVQQNVDGGQAVPTGIARRYAPPVAEAPPAPEPEVVLDPEPDPEPEPCATTLVMIGFQLYLQDCHGTLFPL